MSRIAVLCVLVMLQLGSRSAEAYPQFQFSTDNAKCTMCHFSPVGGGLINGWGRDESADTISRGGDGSLLHGLWEPPDWLALGGDYRGALGVHDTESPGFDPLAFPMQAEIYSRFAIGDSISINATVGLVGAARPRDPPLISRFASREHYVMWQNEDGDKYARAGRYYAPYGLRQVDMTSYVRRDLGYYKLEETYGASYGQFKEKSELHLTVFTRDPILKVGPEGSGVAAMYERRFRDDTAAWGAQSKVHIGPDSKRYWGGGMLKLWLSSLDLLVLTEVDLGVQKILSASSDPILQGIGHLNLTHFLTTGIMLGTTLEVAQTDFSLRGKDRESVSLHMQYFPKAHWEVMLLGRYERTRQTRDLLSLLMLHYYL